MVILFGAAAVVTIVAIPPGLALGGRTGTGTAMLAPIEDRPPTPEPGAGDAA